MFPLWKCPETPQTGSKWWRVPLGVFCDAGEIEMGPLPGVPRAPKFPAIGAQNNVGSEALRVQSEKEGEMGGGL